MSLADEIINGKKKKKKSISDSIISGTYKEEDFFSSNKKVGTYTQEIAPVKTTPAKQEKKRSWFESGAFSDGYQFGDVTKTILGTNADIQQDLTKGILKIGEGVIDTGAYLLGGGAKLIGKENFSNNMKDFVSRDLVEESGIANMIANNSKTGIINRLINGDANGEELLNAFSNNNVIGAFKNYKETQKDTKFEDSSILGDKSDSLVQSGGQLAGTVGLQAVGVPWWVTTGATSFGGETEQAFSKGATYGEAGISGLVSAGAEILTEKLSGGISFGGKTLDDVWLKPLTDKIANKTVQNLTKFGLDVVGEGGEEVLSSVISKLGQKLTYEDEQTWQQMFASEEAFDEYLESFIGGMVLSGGANSVKVADSIKNKTNYDTGLTDAEEQKAESLAQELIAEQESNGKKLTNKQKDSIKNNVMNAIKNNRNAKVEDVEQDKLEAPIQQELELEVEQPNAQNITDKTYYHGTRGNFDTFDNSKIGQNYEGDWSSLGKGFYFTNDSESAKKFGESSINEGEVTVKEAKLDIKKPFYVDDFTKNDNKTLNSIKEKYELGDITNGYNLIDVLKKKGLDSTEVLKESGYDGIIAEDEVMVFDASQINTNKQDIDAPVQETPMQDTEEAVQTDITKIKDNQGREVSKEIQEELKESKVRDDKGNLLTVYHGTDNEFSEYTTIKTEPGYWFTENKEYANEHGKNIKEQYLNLTNPIDDIDTMWDLAKDYFGTNVTEKNLLSNEFKEHLKSLGYDGMVWDHSGSNTYVAFDSNQIKNIDNTKSTKSPSLSNKDIQTESVQTETPTQQEIDNLLDIQKNKSGSEYASAFYDLKRKYGDANLYKALNEEYSRQKNGTKEVVKQVEEVIKPLQETVEKLAKQIEDINTTPVSQEVVEQQGKEAFNTITDNDMSTVEDTTPAETEQVKADDPFKNRDIDEVGKRSVKAYQYENPEVRPYFQQEAQNMLYDLDNTVKGEKGMTQDELGNTDFYGTTRQTTEAIAYLKDNYGYSYAQIRKGLNDIIEDNGKENNAVAKRIEFMLDERLREGYITSDGIPIPANKEYINFLNEKQITEYNTEASKTLTDTDAPTEIAPVEQEVAPEPQKQVIEQPKTEVKEIAPLTEKVAQNENTEQPEIRKETQEEEKIAQILSETPTKENKKQRLWAKFRAGILDKGSAFEDLSIRNKNRELMSKWDYMLSAESRSYNVMMNGYREIDALNDINNQHSKSLIDIQAEVGDKVQEFSEYLYHKHNISRMSLEANAQAKMQELQTTTLAEYDVEAIEKLSRKRITEKTSEEVAKLIETAKEYVRLSEVKNKPVFGDSVTADVSQEIVNEYEMNNPEFMDWAKDVYDYNNANLDQLVQSGVISQETADQFAEMYPNYVPIGRAKHLGNAINVPLDTNRTTINTPIKGAKGGNSDILPLFDTMARRTLQTYRAVSKNNFGVELKNTLKGNKINQTTNVDEILENVDQQESLLQEGKDGKAPTFTVFENGEKVTYEITQDMYEALKPVSDSSILSTTFKPFNKISNFHRGVLTEYNPVFMLTNSIKDAQDVLMNSQHPAKTYAKFGESYAQIVKKGYWYQEYMANGGEQNSYFDSQEGTFNTERKGIEKVLDTFPLRQISQLNNVIEMAPRLAEYIASRELGRSIETSMLDAARVTTNFKAGGDITKWANRNGATFLNASIQGAMQQVRNIREANANGLKGYANLALKFTIAGVPALLLNGLLWSDDDEYEELSDYVKQNYYIVGKYGDGNFIRIPKGRMVSVIQESFNQMKHLITGDGEADLGQFLEIMGSNIAPNNPIENNVLSPIIQATTNTTWYGDDLVPTRLQDEPVKEQFDESTDKLSIFLGQNLGISPYKINYVLDQYSGGIGDVFLPMMTQQAETGTDDVGSKLIAPLTNKFTVDSVMKNQNVSDLYSKSEELTSKANSTSATDEDILQNKYLNSIKSEMNVLYKEKREIQNSNLSDSEKYNQVREIQEQINNMAKNAMSNYENVQKTSNYATIGDKEYYLKNDTWTKVDKEEQEELNSLNMDIKAKSTYFNLKSEISKIKDSTAENKKSQIAIAVKNTNLTDQQKAYVYGKNYSSDETLDLVINTGISFNEYLDYASQEFEADKYSNGKTISGSRKIKVYDYLNSMNIDYEQKLILAKMEYPADDRYNYEIIEYLNNNSSIDYDTMESILLELGFKVDAYGNINW